MKGKTDKRAYLYILPAVALAVTFSFWPFLKTLFLSFFRVTQTGAIKSFAGMDNYANLIGNPFFMKSVKNTLSFALFFLPLNTVVTLAAASLTRRDSRGNRLWSSVYVIPLALSLSLISMIFLEIFSPGGSIINRIFGLDVNWLNTKRSAWTAIVILSLFLDFGIDYVLLLSAFRRIERNIIDASLIDGANETQRYFLIELPQILPTLFMTMFLAFKDALLICSPILTMTEGGPMRSTETVMFYYYIEAFKSGNRNQGAALTVLVVALSAFLVAIYALVQARTRHEENC